MDLLKLWALTGVAFVAIDMLWLGVIAKKIYQKELGKLLAPKPNLLAAALFYPGYTLFLTYFGLLHPVAENLSSAVLNGALIGGMAYFTYELTNMATLKKWSWLIVLIDLLWGILLSAVSVGLAYSLFR